MLVSTIFVTCLCYFSSQSLNHPTLSIPIFCIIWPNNFFALQPYKNKDGLQSKIHQYLKWVKNVESIRSRYPEDVLDIDYSQLLKKPAGAVRKLCKFLELHCSREYIQSCRKKIFQKETKTRLKVFWPKKLKLSLAKEMKVLAPYRQFSFSS